jgi:hypothetical protein
MKKSVSVLAQPEIVWKAILSYRESQPHRRRILKQTDGAAVIEETFTGLPLVGSSRIVYEETEQPFVQIRFRLIDGEHVSKFDGSWTLAPQADLQTTEVIVQADFDIKLSVPFKDVVLDQLAEQDIGKRLAYVKQTAERNERSD